MTLTSDSLSAQLPASYPVGGLAVVVPTLHVTAPQVTFLHGLAHQYVDRFGASPVTLPYSPTFSTRISGEHVQAVTGLRVDTYRAPSPEHARAASFGVWARRSAAQAQREGFGALLIPPVFADAPPGLVVTDVDSTLIAQEVIEEIADYAGVRDLVKSITDRAMNGEIDFSDSLRERVATLKGLPVRVFTDVARHVEIHAGAQALVDTVHRFGGVVGVVSGGFEEVVSVLTAHLGIDHMDANRFEVDQGVLTGRVLGEIVTGDTKEQRLRQWAKVHDVPIERTVAVGDGSNDVQMMRAAGLGVAFCAKPSVREAVDSSLVIPRLDVLTCLF